jgi:hypothetical protein
MKTIEVPSAKTRDAAIVWLAEQGRPGLKHFGDEWIGDGWRIHETFVNIESRGIGVRNLVIERRIYAEIQDDELGFEFALRFGS